MSSRVVVVGAAGMLGAELIAHLPTTAIALNRKACDILSMASIEAALRPDDIVINCAGVPNGAHAVNSLGPHYLALFLRDGHLYHVSTDCVFAGDKPAPYRYAEQDTLDANSPYGLAKCRGEVRAANVTNVRTSFVGEKHGLLDWLRNRPSDSVVPGYTNAYWTGSYVEVVADALVGLVEHNECDNIVHLATEYVYTKYELLRYWCRLFDLEVRVEAVTTPCVNRALVPTIELEPILE